MSSQPRNIQSQKQDRLLTLRPQVTSYDSGHEHSIEHWIEVRLMVEESAEETAVPDTEPASFAAQA